MNETQQKIESSGAACANALKTLSQVVASKDNGAINNTMKTLVDSTKLFVANVSLVPELKAEADAFLSRVAKNGTVARAIMAGDASQLPAFTMAAAQNESDQASLCKRAIALAAQK